MRSINRLFPKIDHLEYFPLKVLLQILTAIDDIDLLSLTENSNRFENIAKIVSNERYTHKYFQVDAIKSEIEEEYRWITSLLDRTRKLEKLKSSLRIIYGSHENLSQQHRSFTNRRLILYPNFVN